MKHLKIYHNPRCSKSRKTLQIIRDHGVEPEVVEYLKKPPTENELKKISNLLGLDPKRFVRVNENDFKENGLSEKISDNEAMFRLWSNSRRLSKGQLWFQMIMLLLADHLKTY